MKKRFQIINLIISFLLLILSIILSFIYSDAKLFGVSFKIIIILPLTLIAYLLVGIPYYIKAFKHIIKGNVFDEITLTLIATIAAFCIGEYIEGLAVILFFKLGSYIEEIGYNKSKNSVKTVLDMRPDSVTLFNNGTENKVDPYECKNGDLFIVKPGERVPLDGIIISGNSTIDTSSMTGESLPKKLKEGDKILSGFVNKSSPLVIKATTTFYESTLSKVLEMVENATNTKTKEEKFISKFAKIYTPIVVSLAFIVAIIPPLFLGISDSSIWSNWIYKGASFLVVSCPCSLVISVPMSFFIGIGEASKFKALIKGSVYIEKLNKLDTIVLDKTGTITKGNFEVSKINNINDGSNIFELALASELYSNHPIAQAIKNKVNNIVINKDYIKNYLELEGLGISLDYKGKKLFSGNQKLMEKYHLNYVKSNDIGTIVYINYDNSFIGSIVIRDLIKEDSKLAISNFKQNGINYIYMLTGDNKVVANDVASEVGINNVYSDLLPDQKGEILNNILKNKKRNSCVGFVGDGINDALSLKEANIGFSMGALGSDAAIEASDIVLMNDSLNTINIIKKLAKRVLFIVYLNIILSIFVKILVMILTVANLLGNYAMWFAIFGDVGVTLICILNALSLLLFNPKKLKKVKE